LFILVLSFSRGGRTSCSTPALSSNLARFTNKSRTFFIFFYSARCLALSLSISSSSSEVNKRPRSIFSILRPACLPKNSRRTCAKDAAVVPQRVPLVVVTIKSVALFVVIPKLYHKTERSQEVFSLFLHRSHSHPSIKEPSRGSLGGEGNRQDRQTPLFPSNNKA